jgi:molecular chaperone GrpE
MTHGDTTQAGEALAGTGRGDEPTTTGNGDGPGGAAAPPGAGPTVAELEDRWRRAVAELDNLRKRFERQLTEQARAERARTAAAFLPVLDNLELAMQHAQADPAAIVAGVQAVREQAVHVLAALGYERIGAVGERFDPARHEAVQAVPPGDGVEPGTVTGVLRPGYADADGALLRPAVVAVARNNE